MRELQPFHWAPKKIRAKSFFGCFEKEQIKHPYRRRMCYFLYFPKCKRAGHFKTGLKITVSAIICNLEPISRKLPKVMAHQVFERALKQEHDNKQFKQISENQY